MQELTNFTRLPINLTRAEALAELLTACKEEEVEIENLFFFQNGFQIMFKGIEGDAIIHDGSYGRNFGLWETYKMPWDCDDVSVLEADVLAKRLGALKRGEDWEKFKYFF